MQAGARIAPARIGQKEFNVLKKNEFTNNLSTAPVADLEESALLALCCQQLPQETRAFEVLVRRIQPQIYRHALRYLQQPEDAWEVTQEVLLRLFRNLHRFEGRSRFNTWLYRIVENQCHSFVEARSRRTLSDHVSALIQIHEETHRSPQEEEQEDTHCVTLALTSLPAASREVLHLRFVAEQSLEEIAQTLDIGLSATKMRLYRALESLRTAYHQAQLLEA